MDELIEVLHELVEKGFVREYAIGGAGAVQFFTEPVLTFDMDVFVVFPEQEGKLIDISPLYEFLRAKGYAVEKEHVRIGGVPTQFLPVSTPLRQDAMAAARTMRYGTRAVRVMSLEHVAAMMVETGRPKDWMRLAVVAEAEELDRGAFLDLLKRFGLWERWKRFRGSEDAP